MKKNLVKINILFISFCLIFSFFHMCFADDDLLDNETIDVSSEIPKTVSDTSSSLDSASLNSRACIVLDRKSNRIIYGKNEKNKVKMASTTKIMTATIVIENYDLSKTVEISKKAAGTGGSRLGLKQGDKISVLDLLHGLMLCSGNDAAVALAETVAGGIPEFSDMMNNKAKELGLENTHFESPHGLDSDNHYTTAYDLSLLTNYALNNETFLKIVGTKNYTVTINGYPKNITNTNELLGTLNGVYGVKTGFTNGANRCLVTACKRNDLDIICVVLGCDTKNFRTKDSIKLIEYTFQNYEYLNISDLIDENLNNWKEENFNNFNIKKGVSNNIEIYYQKPNFSVIPIKKADKNNIEVIINIDTNLTAPVYENSEIGNLYILCNGEEVFTTNILSPTYIPKKNISNYYLDFFKNYSSLLNGFSI